MYNLLDLLVWGRRSRTWLRWHRNWLIQGEYRHQLSELAWVLWYGLRERLFKEKEKYAD